jgi:hypothetical protein
MALRGTLTHWKTRTLAEELGVSPAHALGLLESLWHVTAEDAPSGNIGRLHNKAIVMQMFTDIDPDRLIAALVKSGHLDVHPVHRLIVHDWAKHSDYNTRRKVERRGEKMCSASPTLRQSGGDDASSSAIGDEQPAMARQRPPLTHDESIPEPEPEPEPEKKLLADSASAQPAGAVFELPLKDGSSYGVPAELYAVYCKSYPAVNVMGELEAMRAWILSNPGKRKTRAGIKAFINNWLSRERDKPEGSPRKRPPRAENFESIDYAKSWGLAPGTNVGLI